MNDHAYCKPRISLARHLWVILRLFGDGERAQPSRLEYCEHVKKATTMCQRSIIFFHSHESCIYLNAGFYSETAGGNNKAWPDTRCTGNVSLPRSHV